MGWDDNGVAVQISAIASALLAALVLNWTEKRWPKTQEPLIGIAFILAATGGILLLASDPHGGEQLKDLLVGQILWSTWSSLLPVVGLYAILLTVWFSARNKIGPMGFYLTFAISVTASVQIVGIYLVFASLIIPALATARLMGNQRLLAAYTLGALAYASGVIVSAWFDLPTGAVIVWTMALLALVSTTVIAKIRTA